jgi:outer membrane lipoprotein SlyB
LPVSCKRQKEPSTLASLRHTVTQDAHHHKEEITMNMSVNSISKTRAHPILIVAGTAVVLVCLTGTAALLGWLPSSVGATGVAVAPAQPMMAAADGRQAEASRYAAPHRAAAAPVAYRHAYAEPVHHERAQVCQNCGTVDSIREITTRGDSNGLGAAGGAVVGGLLGNQVGGGHGRQAMTVVGAIGGALAGNQIQKQVNGTRSYETTVHMDNGSTRTVAQETQPGWHGGEHVKIVNGVVQMNG